MDSRETMPEFAEALRYHGGNVNAARQLFPDAPEPWIDLSTGINQAPYPVAGISADTLVRLPEPMELAALETVAASVYRAIAPADVVAASGTQAIIQCLPHIVPGRRVAILGPTYGEHEKRWRAAGADIVSASNIADFAGCDVGIVVNPNNPDGRILTPESLIDAASTLAATDGMLIVDEAFMDVVQPSASVVPTLPANAIVLRSIGKAYGLAGLRLGFAIAGPGLAGLLRDALGPWPVSGPAIAIGRRALADSKWLNGAIRDLSRNAERLDRLLTEAGLTVVGGTALFRLARCPNSEATFVRLAQAGILTRPFHYAPGLLRFGIPCHGAQWERLRTALQP